MRLKIVVKMFFKYLEAVASGSNLSANDSYKCMMNILNDKVDDIQLTAFLIALNAKEETVDELSGFARAMRDLSVRIQINSSRPLVDSCGTGGDSFKTYNVSTAAAIIAASSGVMIAKHGNRSITSHCGGADILDALGVNVHSGVDGVVRCIEEAGMGFMFAQNFHPAMKNVMKVRKKIGIPTVFNLLGPLSSPANAQIRLLGVFKPSLVTIMAKVLRNLGVERAMVVHGFDENDKPAMDEISTMGKTRVAFLKDNQINEFDIYPENFGLERASRSDLYAPKTLDGNLEVIKKVLNGVIDSNADKKCLELSLANAGAIIFLTGNASDLKNGLEIARKNVFSGRAYQKLKELIKVSQV
jgi:anthranilate phosphoribosyltransferase